MIKALPSSSCSRAKETTIARSKDENHVPSAAMGRMASV